MRNIVSSALHEHHWHYLYERRRRRNLKNFSARNIAIGQIIALTGSLTAGYILELNKYSIGLIVGTFLLLPGVIDLAASITGAMCAKINHQLQAGGRLFWVLQNSILFAVMLSLFSGLVVGICGGIVGELFFGANFWQICSLCVIVMVAVGMVSYPAMALFTIFVRLTGADPDDIVGPVETGFTDSLTVIAVSLAVRLFV
jgi:cation transporter-like permease